MVAAEGRCGTGRSGGNPYPSQRLCRYTRYEVNVAAVVTGSGHRRFSPTKLRAAIEASHLLHVQGEGRARGLPGPDRLTQQPLYATRPCVRSGWRGAPGGHLANSIWTPIWIPRRTGVFALRRNLLIKRRLVAFFGAAKFCKDTCDWP